MTITLDYTIWHWIVYSKDLKSDNQKYNWHMLDAIWYKKRKIDVLHESFPIYEL